MKYLLSAACLTCVCAAHGVQAQDASSKLPISYTAGLQVTSYVGPNDGFRHVENETEVFLELAFPSGVFTAIEVTSIDDDPEDDFEVALILGYGSAFANGVSWELVYEYAFANESDDQEHEIEGSLGFDLAENLEGTFAVLLDPESGKTDQEFEIERALSDDWAVFALIGNSDRDDNIYGELGVTYEINDNWELELLYEDTNDEDSLLGLTVAYEFGR